MPQYADFLTSTHYGYVDGLKGANCRHDFFGVFDFMPPAYTPEQLKQIAEDEAVKKPFKTKDRAGNEITQEFNKFDATQEMRRRERAMRLTRERAAGFKAGGADDAYKAAKASYTVQRAEYTRFAEAMGLQTEWQRVYVDGIGKI